MTVVAAPSRSPGGAWDRSTTAGLSFRPAVETDLPFLRQVYAATRAEDLAAVPWSDAEKAAFLDMQFRAQHAHYRLHHADMEWLIIMAGDVDIGRLYLEPRHDEMHVIDITLLTAHRGRSLGGAVMRDILAEAIATRRHVAIHVEKFNPAMRLYRRLGFVTVEDKGIYDFMRWVPNDQAKTAP